MRISKLFSILFLSVITICFITLTTGCPKAQDSDPGDSNGGQGSGVETEDTEPDSPGLGDIRGTVFMDGHPYAFGVVLCFDESGDLYQEDRCDETGVYELIDLKPGNYTLKYRDAMEVDFDLVTEASVRPGRNQVIDLEYTTEPVPE